ncbi:MAG: hypothetical protein H7X93_13725 [Sphingomonadaceae bacterium]|nr:hypothetical protein [Sphingomonadaceae bacterium]
MRSLLILPALALLLSGCLVRTAANVVTAPVRAAGQVVDWTTTSQDESDRNYGRRIREEEARRGREAREAEERERVEPESGARR